MARFAVVAFSLLIGCGGNVDLGGSPDDASPDGQSIDARADAQRCGTLSPPDVASPCSACDHSSPACQPNGCFNGYYCDTEKRDCHVPPVGCDGDAASSSSSSIDAGD